MTAVNRVVVQRGRTLASRTVRKAWNDRILGLSAETAFWQLLSLPSLFLALLGSLGFVARLFGASAVSRAQTQLLNGFSRAFSPEVVSQLVAPTVREVLRGGRADVVSVGFVLALWAGSSATATFVNTITIAYGMRDLRGAVRSRLLALWLYLGSIVLGAVLLPMLVLGPTVLTDAFPRSARARARDIITELYWPVVVVLLVVGLTTLYRLAPPLRRPWHRGLPGALLAMLIFVAGSAGLRVYIGVVLANNTAYATLATPIAALLFFYILAFGVLIGAEFNAAFEELHPSRRSRRERGTWRSLPDEHRTDEHRTDEDRADEQRIEVRRAEERRADERRVGGAIPSRAGLTADTSADSSTRVAADLPADRSPLLATTPARHSPAGIDS